MADIQLNPDFADVGWADIDLVDAMIRIDDALDYIEEGDPGKSPNPFVYGSGGAPAYTPPPVAPEPEPERPRRRRRAQRGIIPRVRRFFRRVFGR